ncbi:MAG: FISUMP domain-containing protein [Bacteroidales bacterium]
MNRKLLLFVSASFLMFQFFLTACDKEEDTAINGDNNNSDQNYHGTVTDVDGNVYNTVKIGDQIWMAENLKVTHYNDGVAIQRVETGSCTWGNLTDGAYSWYDHDITNKDRMGAFYNWYAVKSGKLAPQGWHIPTKEEWEQLITFLGNNGFQGDEARALKADSLWTEGGTGTNDYYFNALPFGTKSATGSFTSHDWVARWWTSTEYDSEEAWLFSMSSYKPGVDSNSYSKNTGVTIRCVKD